MERFSVAVLQCGVHGLQRRIWSLIASVSRRNLSQFRMNPPKTTFQGRLRPCSTTKAAIIQKRLQMRPPFPRKMKCTSDGHFAPYHIPESLARRWRWKFRGGIHIEMWVLCFHLLKYLVKARFFYTKSTVNKTTSIKGNNLSLVVSQ